MNRAVPRRDYCEGREYSRGDTQAFVYRDLDEAGNGASGGLPGKGLGLQLVLVPL